MASSLRSTVDFIRNVLRGEGITNEESIDNTVTFFLCRYLNEDICQRLNIPVKYAFSNLLELEEQELYSTLNSLGRECLFRHLNSNLRFKLKSPTNLYKIIHALQSLDISKLEEKYDLLGTIYEYHLKTGNSNARDLGQFFTPRPVIDFMVKLVKPQKGEKVMDPTMGTGGFLTLVAKERKEGKNIFGYDISEKVVSLATINLLLETGELVDLRRRDVLKEGIESSDVILSNIPMGLKVDYETCCSEVKEVGKGKSADHLFVQLYLNSLNLGGRAAIIVSQGFLFSKDSKKTRKTLLETCQLKKVISLAGKTYLNTSARTYILYFIKDNRGTKEVEFSILNLEKEETISFVSLQRIRETKYSLLSQDYEEKVVSEEFTFVTLEEVCHILPKGKHLADYGVKVKDEKNTVPFFTSSQKVKYCEKADYTEEHVIIGDGGKANVNISSYFSCSGHNYPVKSKDPRISNEFLYYYLYENLYLLQQGFRGTGKENVAKSYIKKIKIPLLPLHLQEKLKAAREKIKEAEEKVREAEEEVERRKKVSKELWEDILGKKPSSSLSPKKPSSPVSSKSLFNRLKELKEGKVLDVSHISKEGKNIRNIATPGSRSMKIGHKDLPMVSNNKESFVRALEILRDKGNDYMYCLEIWN